MKRLMEILLNYSRSGPEKVFFNIAAFCLIALALMLLTGIISFSDLIELHRKMIEICPFCMTVA
jgi:hypothetical protein